jgi:hypothetical protein
MRGILLASLIASFTIVSAHATVFCTQRRSHGTSAVKARDACKPGETELHGPGPTMVVADSSGAVVGPAVSDGLGPTQLAVPLATGTVLVPVSGTTVGFGHDALPTFYYTSTDCSGQPLLEVGPLVRREIGQLGNTAYFQPSVGANVLVQSVGYDAFVSGPQSCANFTFIPPNRCCSELGSYRAVSDTVGAPDTFDLSTLSFTPPLRVEVR